AAMTVGEAVGEARDVIAAAGIKGAWREADELYASAVCGVTSAAWLDRERPIAEAVRERLMLAAERRARGWPQAYAAGRANFRGHWLSVDERVLIPRPETEGLVDLVLGALKPGRAVADICTGSGAIAIALALESSAAGVIATDVSADALNVALENAQALGAKERISFRRGDLLAPLLDDVVDVIVSNPPYVASGEWEALESGVKDYEPRLALDGGPDGLDQTRRLVTGARRSLNAGGLIALEVDSTRAPESAALVSASGFERVEVRPDLFGRPRYVLGRQPEHA
ncbi:MAG: peptide chain release factor N(5)-glutamine methyltransferase, partial [Gemmatimonadales bacterium]